MMFRSNSGQTLIEVIVAAGLVVLVLTTLASGIAIGVRNNRVAKDQASAKEYVRQSLEWIRNIRDQAGWETFASMTNNATYCLTTLPASYKSFPSIQTGNCGGSSFIIAQDGSATVFKRQLVLTKTGTPPTEVKAVGTVTWTDGTKSFSSTSSLTLYKWN